MSDNKMYCYVCYEYLGAGETSEPIEVFWYEVEAKKWVGENKSREYKKMQIQ